MPPLPRYCRISVWKGLVCSVSGCSVLTVPSWACWISPRCPPGPYLHSPHDQDNISWPNWWERPEERPRPLMACPGETEGGIKEWKYHFDVWKVCLKLQFEITMAGKYSLMKWMKAEKLLEVLLIQFNKAIIQKCKLQSQEMSTEVSSWESHWVFVITDHQLKGFW